RKISDPKEHEDAVKTRANARNLISAVCAQSAFGLLCPEEKIEALEGAIQEARRFAEAFNATARLTRISIYIITGRIAADDVEGVRGFNSEMLVLMSLMENGLRTLNVKTVRDAANRARSVGQMLSPQAQERVKAAIEAARAAARKIVQAGEDGAHEI